MERSATPATLVERDKLDPSSLAPPKGEMESSFSWTYLFKSPTSSTSCFGEPTLRKLNQVKLLCIPHQALYVISHLESSIKKLGFISPIILLLFIQVLHSLCQNLLLEQTEFPTATPA